MNREIKPLNHTPNTAIFITNVYGSVHQVFVLFLDIVNIQISTERQTQTASAFSVAVGGLEAATFK
jgi:hypothetical protein